MMEKGNMSALIAAQPGPLRDGLRAMLMIMPQIETVNLAGDAPSAVRAVAEHHPALVLLDTSLPDERVSTMVRMIKANEVRSRCLVLADDFQQLREAKAAGADVALVKGFRAAKLFEIISELLSDSEQRTC